MLPLGLFLTQESGRSRAGSVGRNLESSNG